MNLISELQKYPFLLAPMAGITDNAYRSFMKEMGAHILTTELVSAHGIKHQGNRTIKLMKFEKTQSPIGVQVFGEDANVLAEAAQFVQDEGADFVDLNLGCPVNKVVKKGAGSALLKNPKELKNVLNKMKKNLEIPLTIKIRTGWTDATRNADEVCNIAYNEGVTWVTIHGRSRAQAYEGKADWNYIADTKASTKIPVIGNGDITSAFTAVNRLKNSQCDGVMIGRGALKNPWIFLESQCLLNTGKIESLEKNFKQVFIKLNAYLNINFDERVAMLQLRKFAGWFSAGYKDSAKFRKSLFQINNPTELMNSIFQYFDENAFELQKDTSHERFLMGGHG